jgi:hypothetical protein
VTAVTLYLSQMLRLLRAATDTVSGLNEQIERLELAIMEAEGQSDHPAARWLRAHIGGDYEECERLRREEPATYWQSPSRRGPAIEEGPDHAA